MLDFAATLHDWFIDGRPFGVATVVATSGSAVRDVGAVMAVDAGGTALGGVSGGCVEGAVFDAAMAAAEGGLVDRLRFGVAADDPFVIGLTCGGTVDVVVDRVDRDTRPHYEKLLARITSRSPVAEVTVASGAAAGHLVVSADDSSGSIGNPTLDAGAAGVARVMLAHGASGLREIEVDDGVIEVFVRSFPAPPLLIVFGALDLADAVAHAATIVGYRTVVCDARPIFATAERFPHADEVVVAWPHEYLTSQWDRGLIDSTTALCVLTHDAKFDVPLLDVAVRTPAGYIGVLGSRRTHEDRRERLVDRGVGEDSLARLSSPVGLDIGGHTPGETALSIVAEMVAVSNGRSGGRLRDGTGPLHGRTDRGSGAQSGEVNCDTRTAPAVPSISTPVAIAKAIE
ncbi:XdhC family protein [Rhodococcus sp. Leaf278]|uniref:XdhC family protein n=1 Tax=Rhodococcus sp. Leaf278 TaxID=1736319 RepID=UPI0009EAB5FD|nr:XdhC/CoxI family protein [Rhodococcus sp. Leaf278]